MKVDGQQNPLTKNLARVEQKRPSTFDCLLKTNGSGTSMPALSKSLSGDDYYWQHQNQLQQSALTFNPIVSKTHSPPIIPDDDTTIQPESSITAINMDTTEQQMPINRLVETYLTQSTTLETLDVELLLTTIEQGIQNAVSHNDIKRVNQTLSKNNCDRKLIANEVMLANSLFKHYQLFISSNHVELTLNTAQLSNRQTSELQKLIKQWLSNKGYSLKQLMINGVQQ